jgi:hypothetical protein
MTTSPAYFDRLDGYLGGEAMTSDSDLIPVSGALAIAGVVALSLALGVVAHAQSSCDSGVTKAAAKKVTCKLKVFAAAQKTGAGVNAAKLAKCENKFTEKCGKARAKGDCEVQTQTCDEIESEADAAVDTLSSGRPTTTSTTATTTTATTTTTSTTTTTPGFVCCVLAPDLVPRCHHAAFPASASECASIGGTPGPPGTVCDASGACVEPPGAPGDCCQALDGRGCVIPVDSVTCTESGGQLFHENAVCTPQGTCVP